MCTENSDKHQLEAGSQFAQRFNADGLVTGIVQDFENGDILMLAHMNQQAITKTLETGKAWFYSRSRQSLWMKGETSGNTLNVKEILVDCDQDALVLKVKLDGEGACHTGARSCFYRSLNKTEDGLSLSHLPISMF